MEAGGDGLETDVTIRYQHGGGLGNIYGGNSVPQLATPITLFCFSYSVAYCLGIILDLMMLCYLYVIGIHYLIAKLCLMSLHEKLGSGTLRNGSLPNPQLPEHTITKRACRITTYGCTHLGDRTTAIGHQYIDHTFAIWWVK